MEWNLANDPNWEPHTPGGCTECKGALTIDKNGQILRNQAYYIIAQASKFIPTGSKRIEISNLPTGVNGVAVQRPDKKVVLLLQNETQNTINSSIGLGGKYWNLELTKESTVTILLDKEVRGKIKDD